MIHIDWLSFVWGILAAMVAYQAGKSIDNFLNRMIDYYQRKLDEERECQKPAI